MKKIILLSCCFVTLLLAKTEFSLNLGSNSYDSREDLSPATSVGVRGDFYLDDLYHIDLGYDQMPDTKVKGTDINVKVERFYTQFSGDGKEEYHVVPTLSVGAGFERQKSSVDSYSQAFISLGVGFRYNVSYNLNFLLGTKALWKVKNRGIDYHTTVGIGYLVDEAPVNNEKEQLEEVIIPKKKLQIPQEVQPKQMPPIKEVIPDAKEVSVTPVPKPAVLPCKADIVKSPKKVINMGGSFIQVAAFSYSRPTAMLDRLAKSGQHIILRHQGKITKALVGPFKSETEARKALVRVKKISPKAFIYKAN